MLVAFGHALAQDTYMDKLESHTLCVHWLCKGCLRSEG